MISEAAEPAAAPVEQYESEADDHRRDREREVDHGVQQATPGEPAANQGKRQNHADDRVHRHRDRRDDQRQLEGVDRLRRRQRVPRRAEPVVERPPEDSALFQKLRAWRTEQARSEQVPPYIIFSDAVLHELAAYKPSTRQELLVIKGIGPSKVEKYGAQVLGVIAPARK